jgi:hypothetical protein
MPEICLIKNEQLSYKNKIRKIIKKKKQQEFKA